MIILHIYLKRSAIQTVQNGRDHSEAVLRDESLHSLLPPVGPESTRQRQHEEPEFDLEPIHQLPIDTQVETVEQSAELRREILHHARALRRSAYQCTRQLIRVQRQ